MASEGFINYLQRTQRPMWLLLQAAAQDGIVAIDVDNDAISGTNRLLNTNPVLHRVLNTIIGDWADSRCDHGGAALSELLRRGGHG